MHERKLALAARERDLIRVKVSDPADTATREASGRLTRAEETEERVTEDQRLAGFMTCPFTRVFRGNIREM